MPDGGTLLPVYLAYTVGLISPGPDLMLVTALALRYGRPEAVKAALGIACGVGLWVAAGTFGLAALFETSSAVWTGVRFVGGGLLIYIGARGLSAAIRRPADQELKDAPIHKAAPAFGLGLLTNLGNPEAAVVLIALTALLADSYQSETGVLLAASAMPVMAAIWFAAVALVLTGSAVHRRLMAWRRGLDALTSLAIAIIGGLLIQGVPGG